MTDGNFRKLVRAARVESEGVTLDSLQAELARTKKALEIAVTTLESFSGIYENQQISTGLVAHTMLDHSVKALVEIRKELEGE